MSFWYGLPFHDVMEMPLAAMTVYLDRLPARLAELKLNLAEAASVPHLGRSDRKSVLRSWRRETGAEEAARPATPSILRMLGIGVRHDV